MEYLKNQLQTGDSITNFLIKLATNPSLHLDFILKVFFLQPRKQITLFLLNLITCLSPRLSTVMSIKSTMTDLWNKLRARMFTQEEEVIPMSILGIEPPSYEIGEIMLEDNDTILGYDVVKELSSVLNIKSSLDYEDQPALLFFVVDVASNAKKKSLYDEIQHRHSLTKKNCVLVLVYDTSSEYQLHQLISEFGSMSGITYQDKTEDKELIMVKSTIDNTAQRIVNVDELIANVKRIIHNKVNNTRKLHSNTNE